MDEKFTLHTVAVALSQQFHLPRKVTMSFLRTMFETIVQGLKDDGVAKVKGLGVFKIIEVGSRESVNVNNGERIIIPGFRKLSFTPVDSFLDMGESGTMNESASTKVLNPRKLFTPVDESEPVEESEPVDESETVDESEEISEHPENVDSSVFPQSSESSDLSESSEPSENSDSSESSENTEESEVVIPAEDEEPVEELPKDEFSGIDLLISTPEVVDEMEEQLQELQTQCDQLHKEWQQAQHLVEEEQQKSAFAEVELMKAEDEQRKATERVQYALNAVRASAVQLQEAKNAFVLCGQAKIGRASCRERV